MTPSRDHDLPDATATTAPACPSWEDPVLVERLADYIATLAEWQHEDHLAARAREAAACPARKSA